MSPKVCTPPPEGRGIYLQRGGHSTLAPYSGAFPCCGAFPYSGAFPCCGTFPCCGVCLYGGHTPNHAELILPCSQGRGGTVRHWFPFLEGSPFLAVDSQFHLYRGRHTEYRVAIWTLVVCDSTHTRVVCPRFLAVGTLDVHFGSITTLFL